MSDSFAEAVAAEQLDIVEVRDRGVPDAIVVTDGHFGGQAVGGRDDRSDDHRAKQSSQRVAREDDDRASLVKVGEPDLTTVDYRLSIKHK